MLRIGQPGPIGHDEIADEEVAMHQPVPLPGGGVRLTYTLATRYGA